MPTRKCWHLCVYYRLYIHYELLFQSMPVHTPLQGSDGNGVLRFSFARVCRIVFDIP